MPASMRPAEQHGDKPTPAPTIATICSSVAGTATARTDNRSFGEKCSPTPNISRIDADLGQLARQRGVGHEPRRERPHHHARHQVSHQRRKLQARRDSPEHESEPEAHGEHRDQRCVAMRH